MVMFITAFKVAIVNSDAYVSCLHTIYQNNLTKAYIELAKSPFTIFRKIKDIFFIFTNDFIGLDILSMSAVSCVYSVGCSQLIS